MSTPSGIGFATAVLALQLLSCSQPGQDNKRPAPRTSPISPAPIAPAQVADKANRDPGSAGAGSRLPDFTVLVEQQGPAVVNVVTLRSNRPSQAEPDSAENPLFDFFRRFIPDRPDGGRRYRGVGLGSGFIISQDGFILTNAHVVIDSDDVTVRLADGKTIFKAKVVGVDRQTDVALLKVSAMRLPLSKLGDSRNLKVGEWVGAIGSPFGFDNTITAGIVSAKGRMLPDETFVPFIQTDVAVNPGNSGGPLINLKGEVVGINSQIYSRTGGYMGVSFAIPIEVALEVSKQIREHGKVTRGHLGLSIQEVTPELARSFGLQSATGALVSSVQGASAAEKAGLMPGDVILKYNGSPVADAAEFSRQVANSKPDSKVEIEVWRNGKAARLTAMVGRGPNQEASDRPRPAAWSPIRLGLHEGRGHPN